MKDEALVYFKKNVGYNASMYLEDSNKWIYEKYGGGSPVQEFKLEVPDFELDMSTEKPSDTDYNNAKILYTALKGITNTQASDERLWAGIAHTKCWDFMQYRTKLEKSPDLEKKVLGSFFFNQGNKRSLILHPLARLWWVGRLTYDANAEDKFHAMEYFKSDFSTRVYTLFSSNFTHNPKVTRALLGAINEIESCGIKVGRNEYLETIRYLNMLGGVVILDYLSEEELKQKIINHYYDVNK